jgi:hypothetical protein
VTADWLLKGASMHFVAPASTCVIRAGFNTSAQCLTVRCGCVMCQQIVGGTLQVLSAQHGQPSATTMCIPGCVLTELIS